MENRINLYEKVKWLRVEHNCGYGEIVFYLLHITESSNGVEFSEMAKELKTSPQTLFKLRKKLRDKKLIE